MNQDSNILKIGVLGVGHMGQYHLNVLSSLKTHQIIGIYDIDLEQGANLEAKYNIPFFSTPEELIKNVDAVTIATPTKTHYELAKLALMNDCHVLLEKPITETVAQAKELMELAAQRNKILQVGHVERFNGAVMELNKIITHPMFIETRRLAPYNNRIKDTGVVLDLLIHDLDIVVNLVKSPVSYVSAIGHSVFQNGYEDIVSVNLKFENNCVANLMASKMSQKKDRLLTIAQQHNTILLNYTNQDIEIYRQAASASLVTKEKIRYSQESFVEKLYIHSKENPLKSEHIHFYNCIMNGETPLVSNKNDIEILNLALQIIDQIKNPPIAKYQTIIQH